MLCNMTIEVEFKKKAKRKAMFCPTLAQKKEKKIEKKYKITVSDCIFI